jgi:hypothetical protein
MTKHRELLAYELEAVQAFASAHGRRWKSQLTDVYWYNARIWMDASGSGAKGSALHGLRNDPRWGHDGLAAFKLPKAGV